MSYADLLTEDCTVWILSGRDGFNQLSFEVPRTILVRFQDKIQRQLDDNGTEFISRAIIYATEALPKSTFIYRGISTELDPKDQADAYQLRISQRSQNPQNVIVVLKHTI